MRMASAELVRPGVVELCKAPVPAPGPGELLVRVEAALTCGTDIKTYQRGHPKIPLPVPMGHEFSGVVASVGAGVGSFREGDTIACVPTAPCGECRLCRRGRENLCPDAVGRMVFGAFAGYVRLPAHVVECNVFQRPAHMPAEVAAALEPLACVVHGADRIALDRADTVVLLGDGPIALLFVQLARLAGAGRVLVVGKHPGRLEAARGLAAETLLHPGAVSARPPVVDPYDGSPGSASDRLEAAVAGRLPDPEPPRDAQKEPPRDTESESPRDAESKSARDAEGELPRDREAKPVWDARADPPPSLRDLVVDWSGGSGADVVIECVGRPEAWEEAASLAALGGELLLYGGCAAGSVARFGTYQIHYEEVDIKGAFHYGRADVRRAYELLVSGAVRLEPLITHRRPLARLTEALQLVLSREAIKVAVIP